jgi:hypothetical protein
MAALTSASAEEATQSPSQASIRELAERGLRSNPYLGAAKQ